MGQVSRDISVKATLLSPTLTTHVIDLNVDEAREHLLHSLMVVGVVEPLPLSPGSRRRHRMHRAQILPSTPIPQTDYDW